MFIDQLFNPNDVLGIWISSVTTNFTGDISLTLGFMLLCLVILMSIFKMPDMLMVILLVAPIVLFSRVSIEFNLFVGIIILFVSIIIWSLFPAK